jgi:hypothetical protein
LTYWQPLLSWLADIYYWHWYLRHWWHYCIDIWYDADWHISWYIISLPHYYIADAIIAIIDYWHCHWYWHIIDIIFWYYIYIIMIYYYIRHWFVIIYIYIYIIIIILPLFH